MPVRLASLAQGKLRHCTALAAAVIVAATVAARPPALATAAARRQPQAQPSAGDAAFSIFVRGTQVGREQVSLGRTDTGWIITSNGRSAPPLDFTINRFEIKYTTDWQPLEM